MNRLNILYKQELISMNIGGNNQFSYRVLADLNLGACCILKDSIVRDSDTEESCPPGMKCIVHELTGENDGLDCIHFVSRRMLKPIS